MVPSEPVPVCKPSVCEPGLGVWWCWRLRWPLWWTTQFMLWEICFICSTRQNCVFGKHCNLILSNKIQDIEEILMNISDKTPWIDQSIQQQLSNPLISLNILQYFTKSLCLFDQWTSPVRCRPGSAVLTATASTLAWCATRRMTVEMAVTREKSSVRVTHWLQSAEDKCKNNDKNNNNTITWTYTLVTVRVVEEVNRMGKWKE